jgi:hypothetical protein
MLVDEIESENESNSTETTSLPVLRSTYSYPAYNRDRSPVSLPDVDRHFHRSSSQDLSLINKFVSNVRTSIYGNTLFRQLTHRHSSDNINDEVH